MVITNPEELKIHIKAPEEIPINVLDTLEGFCKSSMESVKGCGSTQEKYDGICIGYLNVIGEIKELRRQSQYKIPEGFMIRRDEIAEIIVANDKAGGSVVYRAKIHRILSDVVERTK